MQCKNCGRDTPSQGDFCVYCGSPLRSENPSNQEINPDASSSGSSDEQIRNLQQEITRLAAELSSLRNRLLSLESEHGIQHLEEIKPEITAAPPVEEVVKVPVKPVVERWKGIEEEPQVKQPEKREPSALEREWEQILGGNWLARIGVLSLIIGAGFFLKFAFDRNWLGPAGRVILGVVGGLLMLAGGHYWYKKYPIFAQAISGGGIAILYLSIFAAHSMYDLIGFYPAVVLLCIISVFSAVISIRYNSMTLAIIGIFGAFLAPFILMVSSGTPSAAIQPSHSIWLLVYILIVNLGVLWLSTFRNWRWFILIALAGSLTVFGMWNSEFGYRVGLFAAEFCLTLIFLIFVGATTLYHVLWNRAPESFDYALMILNAGSYYGISYALMTDDLRPWLGGFTLLLALFYFGLAYVIYKKGAINSRLALFALGIALIFLAVAVPVQFSDTIWTTIAWAALGVILVWISYRTGITTLRQFSYLLFPALVIKLLIYDSSVTVSTFTPLINERFLAFLICIAAVYFAGFLIRRNKDSLSEEEAYGDEICQVFFIVANILSVLVLSMEIWSYFSRQIFEAASSTDTRYLIGGLRSARNLSLTGLWAFYSVILLVIGILRRSRVLRIAGLALFVIPICKVYVYDVFALEQLYRIIAFIGLGVLLVVTGYLYNRYKEIIMGFIR